MLLVRLNIFAFILLDWPLHIRWKGKSDPSSLFQTNVSLLILNVKFVSTFAVTEKRLDDSNSCVSWTYLLQVHFHSSSGLFDFLFARRQNPSLSTNQCKSWIYSLSPVVSPHSTWSPPKSMQLRLHKNQPYLQLVQTRGGHLKYQIQSVLNQALATYTLKKPRILSWVSVPINASSEPN